MDGVNWTAMLAAVCETVDGRADLTRDGRRPMVEMALRWEYKGKSRGPGTVITRLVLNAPTGKWGVVDKVASSVVQQSIDPQGLMVDRTTDLCDRLARKVRW